MYKGMSCIRGCVISYEKQGHHDKENPMPQQEIKVARTQCQKEDQPVVHVF